MSGASARLRETAALGDTHQVLRLLEEGATMLPDEVVTIIMSFQPPRGYHLYIQRTGNDVTSHYSYRLTNSYGAALVQHNNPDPK